MSLFGFIGALLSQTGLPHPVSRHRIRAGGKTDDNLKVWTKLIHTDMHHTVHITEVFVGGSVQEQRLSSSASQKI
ncbi:MAG: hypothetical protein AMJ89_06185 [candidate division Zixibacteria bacterium SM23_73]|nr:MAG: hypothetical protein AMJ89_06185 [candidate division Zixibacteria bacterium SM23_73]